MTATDVAVFETFAEAAEHGAEKDGGKWQFRGRRVITCHQNPSVAFPSGERLRVSSFIVSDRALLHPNWRKLEATLRVGLTFGRRP